MCTDDRWQICSARPRRRRDEMFRAPQWQAETKRQNQKPAGNPSPGKLEREREKLRIPDNWTDCSTNFWMTSGVGVRRMRSTAGQSLRAVWIFILIYSKSPRVLLARDDHSFLPAFAPGSSVALPQGLRNLIDNIHDCIIEPESKGDLSKTVSWVPEVAHCARCPCSCLSEPWMLKWIRWIRREPFCEFLVRLPAFWNEARQKSRGSNPSCQSQLWLERNLCGCNMAGFFSGGPVFKMLRKRDIWLWCRGLCQPTDKVDSKHVCRDTYLVVLRLQAQPDSSNFLTNTLQMKKNTHGFSSFIWWFQYFIYFTICLGILKGLGTRLNLCWYKEEDWELHRQKTGPTTEELCISCISSALNYFVQSERVLKS